MVPEPVAPAGLQFVQRCQVAVGACARGDYVERVVSIWQCLDAFPACTSEADSIMAVAATARLAAGFFTHAQLSHKQPQETDPCNPRRAHVNELLSLAQQRYADPRLTLGRLAKELGFSRAYLSRAIAAETGNSFQSMFRAHVNWIRLLAAVDLLQRDDVPIREIAGRIGYCRTNDLDRQFARRMSLSPSRFRVLMTKIPPVVDEHGEFNG